MQKQLRRANTQRVECNKENDILHKEIRRMKEHFEKQISKVVGAAGEGVTKIDTEAQTDNFVNTDVGKQMTHTERDRARHCDLLSNNNVLDLGNNDSEWISKLS